ncbi:hypothetical protein AYL99_02969 [Fonsecaea erecta]|uniref:DNA mismatch repair protein S5 domain-containing protein n=1 Tax=Fonsecaea erecta TaxID=1367422 RepID=A0A178ZVL1_9EURO|nr:hypothetical protein AYL99_02969 [Fonsecaea erecta]OAP63742.1 hypothetical protein AYL99_02969 [Fonsecaea erecta]
MPIRVLPENTVRVLSASQVLTDARSVVKELVENALDARATAITVEISSNTLDVIQVRDNGTGIDIEDRQLLGKQGCTSKIRSLEDLKRLGGSSLGFRGEALASIVELSEAVVVTTRVDGEVVGTSLKYAASGMLSSSSASHPVGTTIRVQNFLSKIPVRKQAALKETTKVLQAIKDLLFSLAFARPEVRLSLSVLKAKKNKINWRYAPPRTPSLTEVATKILGKNIVSECVTHSISSDGFNVGLDNGWKINALLLSPTAVAANARQYISIDGRPVNTDRGTMHQLVKSYKRHVQSRLPSESASVSRPFLLMHIQCPPQSYDVNVEPTKDEVLFGRPDQFLSLMECLFSRAYAGQEDNPIYVLDDDEAQFPPAIVFTPNPHSSDRDLVNAEEEESSLQHDDLHTDTDVEERLTTKANVRNPFTIAAMNAQVQPIRMDMHQTIPKDRDMAVTLGGVSETVRAWTKPPDSPSLDDPKPSPSLPPSPGPPMRRLVKASTKRETKGSTQISDDDYAATTPQKSKLQGWLTRQPVSHLTSGLNVIFPNGPDPDSSEKNPGALETRPRSYLDMGPPPSTSETRRGWGPGQKPFKVPPKRQDSAEPSGVELLTPPSSLRRHHQLSLQKDGRDLPGAFEPGKAGSEDVHSVHQFRSGRASVPLTKPSETEHPRPTSELDDIMDFEHRKKATIAHQRRSARALTSASPRGLERSGQSESSSASAWVSRESESIQSARLEDYGTRFGAEESSRVSTPPRSSPRRNRYLRAVQDLSPAHLWSAGELQLASDEQNYTIETGSDLGTLKIPARNPRAHLANGKIYRTKSSKLLLERIPSDALTLRLILTTNVFKDTNGVILRHIQTLGTSDPYITRGLTQYIDFDDSDASSIDKTWGSVLQNVLKTTFRRKAQDGSGVVPEDVRIVVSKVF